MRLLGLLACSFALISMNVATGQETSEAAEETSTATAAAAEHQAELEHQFAEKLTGATLTGSFTVLGEANDTLRADSYQLETVKKLKGDLWLFQARIQYEDRDVKIPLSLRVLWAGDTPVITLDKILVPGLGTYSARVLFHENQYAGTWSGGAHGGQMFGTIQTAAEAATDAESKNEAAADAEE